MTLAISNYAQTRVLHLGDFVDDVAFITNLTYNVILIDLEDIDDDQTIKFTIPAPSNITMTFKITSNSNNVSVIVKDQNNNTLASMNSLDVLVIVALGGQWVASSLAPDNFIIPNGEPNMIPRINDTPGTFKSTTLFADDDGNLTGINNISAISINGITNPSLFTVVGTTIYNNDLSNYTIGTNPGEFSYFDTSLFYPPPYNDFISNDGTTVYVGGGLVIDSTEFTKVFSASVPVPLPIDGTTNRLQYFVFANDSFAVPDDGTDVVVELEVLAQCFYGTIPSTIRSGITNTSMDGRISSFLFSVQDGAETFVAFDFIITNESIYAVHERLPNGKPSFGGSQPDYESFISMTEISKRNQNDFAKLAIALNRRDKIVRYFVNDVEKYKVSDYWLPSTRTYRTNDTTGPALEADIQNVSFAFGNINALDNSNPVDDSSLAMAYTSEASLNPIMPLVQYIEDAGYIDPKRVERLTGNSIAVGSVPYPGGQAYEFLVPSEVGTANRLFGNGVVSKINYIKVSYLKKEGNFSYIY
jgi:hypothetical protein